MASINFGFTSFTIWPVLLVISILIGSIVTLIMARKYKSKAALGLFLFLMTGLIVGRLVYVLSAADELGGLGQIFNISDGGIHYTAAFFACIVVLFLLLRKNKQPKPLYSGVLTMVGTYVSFSLLIAVASSHAVLSDSDFLSLDGQVKKLDDIRQQRPVVMSLWESSCEPCLREMSLIESAEKQYTNVAFISLNQREPIARVQAFIAKEDVNIEHILLDTQGIVAETKGIFIYPETLFFDTDGQLVYSHTGELSEEELRRLFGLSVIDKYR